MAGYRNAFALSKAEVKNAFPPGTSLLIEHALARTASGHDVSQNELLLVPQPSLDPADPLNFALWRKCVALFCLGLYAFTTNFTSASISSTFPVMALPGVFGPAPVPFSRLGYLASVNVLMIGASNIWWVPLANVFGRRTINLIGLLMLTLCSMWAGLAHGFWNLLAARFFMGAGGGSSDTVCPQVVGDLFFVHQRGRAMAVYTGMQAIGSLIGAVAGGYIVAGNGGLPWLHWTNVVLSATTLLLTFLFVPETLYRRVLPLGSDNAADEEMHDKMRATRTEMLPVADATVEYRPYTLWRSLGIGRYEGHLGRQFLALYPPLLLPGVWLIGLWYAGLVGGIVICSTVGPTIVAMPPFLWGENAGLISVGAIIGSLVGAAYTYLVADLITKRAALNDIHGYSEPEPRLWAAVPGLVLATFGLMTFGFSTQYTHSHSWVGLEFGVGMLAFGLMSVPSVGFNYLIEAYTSIAGDCFVVVTVIRAIVAFAWSFFVAEWVTERGAAEPFGIFAMLMGIFSLLIIPTIMYGKRTRIATARWLPEL